MKQMLLLLSLLVTLNITAQKKPLDHSVYDNWKSIGERMVSNNGAYVVYSVNPQEGDGELVIQNPETKYKKTVPRGYNAVITEDSRFLIFKIKPFFKDTRQAKIKKKKADGMPKDSIAIIELGNDSIFKTARVKLYKTPEKGTGYVAYHLEKSLPDTSAKKKNTIDSFKLKNDLLVKLADSIIRKSIDSIKGKITTEEITAIISKAASQIVKTTKDRTDAEGEDATGEAAKEGTDLILKNLLTGTVTTFTLISEFYFDKNGNKLLLETSRNSKDSNSKALVLLYDVKSQHIDTVMKGFNDVKNYTLDEDGAQLAFVAERDSSEKALQKFYKLWYYALGQDSARLIADKTSVGMQLGYTVSENAKLEFSKDGSKLFFGNSPIQAPKDTTLVDFETAKLDIWHYKDDYLQPQQLKNMDAELKRSYTAVYHVNKNKLIQLGAEDAENITIVNEGNADWVLAESSKGNRVESQWTGRTKSTAYVINTATGERKLIFKNLYANAAPSPAGKFVYWYNAALKNYFTYELATASSRNVTEKIKVPLYDEENDVPDLPGNYGVMGWEKDDSALYVYDQFTAWNVNPLNANPPTTLFDAGSRQKRQIWRFINTTKEFRFFTKANNYLFNTFEKTTKQSSLYVGNLNKTTSALQISYDPKTSSSRHFMSKNGNALFFTIESFSQSPNLYYYNINDSMQVSFYDSIGYITATKYFHFTQLSDINPQQKNYNWGTAELFKWSTYTGKQTEGIVYKPEDFDPKKKYPLICYFYEKLSDGLYNYQNPAPTPSRLNITFFVSRGYIVLAPDIRYTTGHPGNDAYNTIASGARALVKAGFVDSTKIGIQGQSWGGYQVAYLITKTKLFKAAWAGAPVANMTSAYGGIRWESGLNRQFQYEHQQSRIGASLWDKPQLYIENSPLFHLPKVQTPLVIMHNDADGAVPWYQGIELFTGLRRLGKPVWMLNYNGEAHNLIERKNRKDIQVREQQFFDWLLKGEQPTKWITEGVPAIEKGKNWGL